MKDPTPPTKQDDVSDFGHLGEGGDTSRSTAPYRRPDPDARATTPDPAATNYNHPSTPGTNIGAPGEGTMSAGAESGGPSHLDPDRPAVDARRDPGRSRSSDHIADGINRVEDVVPGGEARLSMPSDEAGPSSRSVGVPEIADPNYSAATPGAMGIPAEDSPLGKVDRD